MDQFSTVQSFSRVWLCKSVNCSMPGFPVYHQLPELTQTHVHWVGNAIQPSYPLSSPPLPAFNLSQHQDLFKWVSSSHQVAKVLGVSASALVLPMNIQDWVPLGLTGLISFQSKGLLKESSPTPQFKSTISLALSFLYSPTLTSIHGYTVKTIALTRWTFGDKVISLLFNMLYRLVIAFLLRSKCLLISWIALLYPRRLVFTLWRG